MSSLGARAGIDRRPETDWPSILGTLRDFACPSCGGHHVWRPVGRLVKRLNSYTGFAACRSCGERVFVKRIRRYPRLDPVARAQRDFANADALYRAMPDDESTGVARPLAAIAEVLLFAYVPGVALPAGMRSRTIEDRSAIMERVGSWFAHLHGSDRQSEPGDAEFARRLAQLRERCELASKRHASIGVALESMDRRLEALAGRCFPLVLVHGDAKAENFLLSGNRVVAVDVDYRMRGIAEMDLAQFLVQLRSTRALRSPTAGAQRGRLEAAFLAGYARYRSFDADALAWLETYFTLSLWMDARRRGWLRRLRADAIFPFELRRLLGGV